MSTKTEQTVKMIDEMNTLVQPWINASRAWVSEAEKLQKAAVENMGAALDNNHKMAKEHLCRLAEFNQTLQQQLTAQMERNVQMITSLMQ